MLKGIDPLLSPELLTVLAEMGHGDELAIVDANFPAVAMARRLVRVNAPAPGVLRAVLSLLPLDEFVDEVNRNGGIDVLADSLAESVGPRR